MHAATSDDTGVLSVPPAFDSELRRDVTSAVWMMAAVTVPGLGLLVLLL